MDLLVVDDDFGSRGGMAYALRAYYPEGKVYEATGVSSAIAVLSTQRSMALVLLDLNVDDSRGIETLKSLKAWCEAEDCNPRIVVVSAAGEYDDTLIAAAIDHCATGFITKGTAESIFRSAIELTLAGSIYIPQNYLRSKPVQASAELRFTPREKQVAQLLIQGLTYKQIARRLEQMAPGSSMSDNTVRVHVQRIAWKLRLTDEKTNSLSAKSAVITALSDPQVRRLMAG